jgi:hypothetical protein
MNHQRVVESFKEGKERHGSRIFAENGNLYSYGKHFILAAKRPADKNLLDDKEWVLLNGDKYSVSTSKHQRIVFRIFDNSPSISFSALRSAGLWYDSVKLVDYWASTRKYAVNPNEYDIASEWGMKNKKEWDAFKVPVGATYFESKDKETGEITEKSWHRIGAVLLEYAGKYYLCAMDEGSYFISLLPRKVTSITKAFQALKPREVIKAEKAGVKGVKVVRQGEWFFIPVNKVIKEKEFAKQSALPATVESSNQHVCKRLVKVNGEYFVKGRVRHIGRFGKGQHKTVILGDGKNDVYKAVKNTSKGDWSSHGNVD